jgi:purine-binding chemotaxis protein CheW
MVFRRGNAMTEPALRHLCTFRVDGILFGVEVTRVQEVLRCQPTTPVPLAHSVVSGLINLRGQIVTALELRQRLGLAPRAADQHPLNIVVRGEEGIVSLLVDEIDDVLEVDESLFELPPETLSAAARALIEGVYKLSPQLLLVLDTRAAARVEPDRAAKERR